MKTLRVLLPVLVLTLTALGAAMAADSTTAKPMDCESCCCCEDRCDKSEHDKAKAGHAHGEHHGSAGEKAEKGCC